MGLIAAALEERGIRTICLSTMTEIMKQVAPPRWLDLPFPMGFPLGEARNPELQRRILRRALRLLQEPGPGPVGVEYDPREPETPAA